MVNFFSYFSLWSQCLEWLGKGIFGVFAIHAQCAQGMHVSEKSYGKLTKHVLDTYQSKL